MGSSQSNHCLSGFYAYPSLPKDIGVVIRTSIEDLKRYAQNPKIQPWEEMDIFGKFIAPKIREEIEGSDFLIADITEPNFNVNFELGYAIGKGKRILITRNKSIRSSYKITDLGLFDTIGYKDYQNSRELLDFIKNLKDLQPLSINNQKINETSPIYLVEAMYKTDEVTHIISRVKKAALHFRSFDPQEKSRLSAYEAIEQIEQSLGIILYLLPDTQEDYLFHNLRVAFLAGLASGMEKELLVMQFGDLPAPLDVRDIVFPVRHPSDTESIIHEFALKITEQFQKSRKQPNKPPTNILSQIHLGASSAENELHDLQDYYLETDEYKRTQRGEVRLVVGRKGSGKTAIFIQVRDHIKQQKQKLVLDLKPDGYKLIKFKEAILSLLKKGTLEHIIMAFWEYLLLLELCHKIIETDRDNHLRNSKLFEPYNKIRNLYEIEDYAIEGDFSERMSRLLERIRGDYLAKFPPDGNLTLNSNAITELIHKHDVKKLREEVENYIKLKEEVWLLFDNLDKGWPSHGLQPEDISIIRGLIEALRNLERQLQKHSVKIHSVLFLRNDVYELLIQETSDRGKEAKAVIDWKDPDHLKELIRRRLIINPTLEKTADGFAELWNQIFISHYQGEETSKFLIDRSLMRPRHVIDLINHCKSYAVNLGHLKITEEDITKGIYAYSCDLVTNINLEIGDIYPKANNIIYAFIGCNNKINLYDIEQLLLSQQIDTEAISQIIDILLWHAVIGIDNQDEPQYIYDLNYNFNLMKAKINNGQFNKMFTINPAFWPALEIQK